MSTINLGSRSSGASCARDSWYDADYFGSWSMKCMNGVLSNRIVICSCFAAIGIVSFLDTYFVAANPWILTDEQNPICAALMELEPDSKIYFFIVKLFGSVSVLLALWYLQKTCYRYATTVLLSVTAFQIVLLTYLCLSDPLSGGYPNFALLFQDTPESIFRL